MPPVTTRLPQQIKRRSRLPYPSVHIHNAVAVFNNEAACRLLDKDIFCYVAVMRRESDGAIRLKPVYVTEPGFEVVGMSRLDDTSLINGAPKISISRLPEGRYRLSYDEAAAMFELIPVTNK